MSPERRKSITESELQRRGIPINQHLPLIEPLEEVRVRAAEELLQRLIALWAVVGAAFVRDSEYSRAYIIDREFLPWLSNEERTFLLSEARTPQEYVRFSWRLECLYFLAWCGGLIPQIEIPEHESNVQSIMHLFPKDKEAPSKLKAALRVRSKAEIWDWVDLLYRLHWAIRDAHIKRKPPPPKVNGGAIQEWHHAVNWMTCYSDQDDWDEVSTDT